MVKHPGLFRFWIGEHRKRISTFSIKSSRVLSIRPAQNDITVQNVAKNINFQYNHRCCVWLQQINSRIIFKFPRHSSALRWSPAHPSGTHSIHRFVHDLMCIEFLFLHIAVVVRWYAGTQEEYPRSVKHSQLVLCRISRADTALCCFFSILVTVYFIRRCKCSWYLCSYLALNVEAGLCN